MLDHMDVEAIGGNSVDVGAPEGPGTRPGGILAPDGLPLTQDTMPSAAADSPGPSAATLEPVTRHPCSATTRSGSTCGRIVATVATPDGWRCPSHRPKSDAPAASRPPVRFIRKADDAARLASWAAMEVIAGRMTNVNGNAVANLCREFRRSYDAGKHGAAYDAAVDVVDAVVAVLGGLAEADPSAARAIAPAGGPLDRAIKAYLAAARRAVTAG